MVPQIQKSFSFNFRNLLIEEIALSGLDGIGIDFLWRRIGKHACTPLTEKMKIRYWNFLIHSKSISFYRLPTPVPYVEIVDRFKIVDEDTGQLKEPDDYIDGPYEYAPVTDEYGSCLLFKTRKLITKEDLQSMSYQDVVNEYGDHLVLVACLEERWRALVPHLPMTYLSPLTPLHYCILELIGKSRENGQMTVGKTNLTKIVKEPKHLFYNRQILQKLDFIRIIQITQITASRGVKSILIRLKRFHNPAILSLPKTGKLYNVTEYLLQQPNYCEKTDIIVKKNLLTYPMCKKLQKTINIFNFYEESETGGKRSREYSDDQIPKKRKYISLCYKSEESSQSEEETSGMPLECQYKIGVSLLRQAYETLLDAGLKGLTQIEMAELLGIEFYTSRTIFRIFKTRHIIREYMEDKGRQRTARTHNIITNVHDEYIDDDITEYLKDKGENGATYQELFDKIDSKCLNERLAYLDSKNIIKRVGYNENRIILPKFLQSWTLQIQDKLVTPSPWLTVEPDIRYTTFFKWAGTIMNKVFENPGCSITYLSEACEFLTCKSTLEICTVLAGCHCVTLTVLNIPKVDLFSDDDVTPVSLEFNKYESPENIFVSPVKDALTRYSFIKNTILNK